MAGHQNGYQRCDIFGQAIGIGGIVGEVVHIKDDRVTIKSGESRVVVERARIASVVAPKAEAAAS